MTKIEVRFFQLLLLLFPLFTAVLSWWSYGLVDRNLTLSAHPLFFAWQQEQWHQAENSVLWTRWYQALVFSWTVFYALFLWKFSHFVGKFPRFALAILGSVAVILLVGHNALSHDIFNYLFNAKMVVLYGANPHVQVALDFPNDLWLRFMHNVHTPAPYGWGWTALSLTPFGLASLVSSSFVLAYLAMKGWMFFGWGLLLLATWYLLSLTQPKDSSAKRWQAWSLVAFHPLILIETLLNGHNDVWMMAPALGAFVFLFVSLQKKRSLGWILLALLLGGISISTKFVTLLLIPVFGLIWLNSWYSGPLKKWSALLTSFWPEISVVLMSVPLFTARSQQFHPWYLIWVLVFLPFVRVHWLRVLLLCFSLTSLLRYSPWLMNNLQYTDQVQWQMRVITWSAFMLFAGWLVITQLYKKIILKDK